MFKPRVSTEQAAPIDSDRVEQFPPIYRRSFARDGMASDEETTSNETGNADESEPFEDEGTTTEVSEESPDAEMEADEADSEDAAESRSVTDVETIVVDSADVIRAFAYNGQEDIPKGKAIFALTPPFGETVEPTMQHLDDDLTSGTPGDEVHIRPFRFVTDGRRVIEQRPTRQLAKEELEAEDPDDSAIEAWIDEAMETWKAHARDNLVDSVDIYTPHGMAFIDVEYRDEE